MRNSIFTDSEQWAELALIERKAERLEMSTRLLMETVPTEASSDEIAIALLAVATRLEALTYVVARIGGGDE